MFYSKSDRIRKAKVRFLTIEEGGRFSDPGPNVRSQIDLGAFQTSCVVRGAPAVTSMPRGEEVDVVIEVLFPEAVEAGFAELTDIRLFEGNKLVAEGRFVDK